MKKKLYQASLNEIGLTFELLKSCKNLKVCFGHLIRNKDKKEVSAGCGNGDLYSDKVISECIEHYFLSYQKNKEIFKKRSLKEIVDQQLLKKDQILKKINSSSRVQVISFQSIISPEKSCFIPQSLCFLNQKSFIQEEIILRLICSSSGYSFGLNYKMALEHGVFELIERHQISKLYYYLDNSIDLSKYLTCPSLKEYKNKIEELENKFNGKIKVFCLSEDFACYTIVSIFYPHDLNGTFVFPQLSAKTKLSKSDAIIGSLDELTQILYFYGEEGYDEYHNILKTSQLHNKYDILSSFNTLFNIKKLKINNENKDYTFKNVLNSLQKNNYEPLVRTVHEFSNGHFVLQSFIPGFERYNITRLSGREIPVHGNF